MCAVVVVAEVAFDELLLHGGQRGRIPFGRPVLVDEQCTHALGKVMGRTAADGHVVLDAEHVGQRAVTAAVLQFPGQRGRGGAAAPERVHGRGQPFVTLGGQGQQTLGRVLQAGHAHGLANEVEVLAQVGRRAFGLAFMRIQQVGHLGLVGCRVGAPACLQDVGQHRIAGRIVNAEIAHAGKERVRGVHRRSGQCQEESGPARQSAQEPAAPHVREEPDADLGHGDAGLGSDHTVRGAGQQTQAAPHDDAVPPAEHRLRAGVDAIVQRVFQEEEALCVGVGAVSVFLDGMIEVPDITAGTECARPGAIQHDGDDVRIPDPLLEARQQLLDHGQ